MTLHALVAALGGDLYAGGQRASVPAPGHSAADRSVSLLLSGDRLIVHSFGAASWTAVRDHLRALGHTDGDGRLLTGAGHGAAAAAGPTGPRPSDAERRAAACRLWAEAGPVSPPSLSARHLAGRAIRTDPALIGGLRHHGSVPLSVYGTGGGRRPALVAAITAPEGELTAVEVTYLAPGGARDPRLRTPRKMVGRVPPGSAVRLAPQAPAMVVGEGVMSVLSAAERFALPAWALLSACNLAVWTPPIGTRRVMIAADRGATGEAAAARLLRRLRARRVEGVLAPPPDGAEDWNAWAVGQRREEGG
jgi:putative DNA primase/helicase